jgi:hypothetical protein
MCPIPNGFWDGAVSLYSSKIVDKKEILRTVSNTGIYCSGTFPKIPPTTSMQFVTPVRTWRVARLYSAQYSAVHWNSSVSETVWNRTHVHIHLFCLEWSIPVVGELFYLLPQNYLFTPTLPPWFEREKIIDYLNSNGLLNLFIRRIQV